MALFVKQEQQRSELQERVAAELQEKLRQKPEPAGLPDGVDDAAFLKGTKKTTSLAWVWAVIAVLAISAIIWAVVASM